MNPKSLPLDACSGSGRSALVVNGYPLTVRQAALFLGVSPQTVYLWVKRKQIPHLRLIGRNIRFLRTDLEHFRAGVRHAAVDSGKQKASTPALLALGSGASQQERL